MSRFSDAVRAVTSVKPVIVLKTGRNKTAQRAAASHTAALAGDYRITAAALRQAGVRLVEDGLSLLDVAAALASQPPLRGNRIAIITNSGGTGVELTDLLEDEGLAVPQLSQAVQAKIRNSIPAYGSAGNPVDVTTDWPRFSQMYGETLNALMASDEVDAIVPVLLQRSALMPEVTMRIIARAGERPRRRNPKADPNLLGWSRRRRGKQAAIALGRDTLSPVDRAHSGRRSEVPSLTGPPQAVWRSANADTCNSGCGRMGRSGDHLSSADGRWCKLRDMADR